MVAVGVMGVAGRMGSILARLIQEDADLHLAAGAVSRRSGEAGTDIGILTGIGTLGLAATDSVACVAEQSDVLVDFSVPEVAQQAAEACRVCGTGLVTGTTGLSETQRLAVARAAAHIPVVMAPNMSLGVNVALKLVETAAQALWSSDIEITELHHREKVDAPSGTALRFGEVASQARSGTTECEWVHGRQGHTGARPSGAIGFHALRGGDVVGEHTVTFAGAGERVEIIHRAQSRSCFAAGALQAIKFVSAQGAAGRSGLFGMHDVLGL